jgi:hypothetical protein
MSTNSRELDPPANIDERRPSRGIRRQAASFVLGRAEIDIFAELLVEVSS